MKRHSHPFYCYQSGQRHRPRGDPTAPHLRQLLVEALNPQVSIGMTYSFIRQHEPPGLLAIVRNNDSYAYVPVLCTLQRTRTWYYLHMYTCLWSTLYHLRSGQRQKFASWFTIPLRAIAIRFSSNHVSCSVPHSLIFVYRKCGVPVIVCRFETLRWCSTAVRVIKKHVPYIHIMQRHAKNTTT